MIIFVDGPQVSGKTTLIEHCLKYGGESYKFDFTGTSNLFKLRSDPELCGLQIGKDLAILDMLKFLPKDKNYWIDRGVLSSCYYSLITGRMDRTQIRELLYLFSDKIKSSGQKVVQVWVSPEDQPDYLYRDKRDGFDHLHSKEGSNYFYEMMGMVPKDLVDKVLIFNNSFLENPDSNSISLISEISKEEF